MEEKPCAVAVPLALRAAVLKLIVRMTNHISYRYITDFFLSLFLLNLLDIGKIVII